MNATRVQHPITDHLWQLGFTVESKAERLPLAIPTEGGELVTTFEITAYPNRGEARRHFGRKGPAKAEVKSNVPMEKLIVDHERGDTTLKDLYTEKCAAILLDMLKAAAPSLTMPKAVV